MPNLPTVLYGPEMLTVEETSQRVVSRLLGRLPPSIYIREVDAPSLQKVFSKPLAHEIALWLETATVLRDTTLLLKATGSDLERLLRDYGLQRYNQRPDAYARQVAIQILWKPHGTVHALDMLLELLVPEPHTVRRSGRQQWHGWIAATHDVITNITYWSLNSQIGQRLALWVANGTLLTSTIAPPGIDTTGAPTIDQDVPLFVFLRDSLGAIWQISIDADEGLHIDPASPAPLPALVMDFMIVQDAMMVVWYFGVTPDGQTYINSTPPSGLGVPVGHGRILREPFGSFHRLGVTTTGEWDTPSAIPPASVSIPARQTLTWMHVPDTDGVRWYVGINAGGGFLVTDVVPRWGQITEEPFRVLDGQGQSWSLNIAPVTLDLSVVPEVSDPIVVVESGIGEEYFVLLDTFDVPWYFTAPHGVFTVSGTQPTGTNVTPPDGPFTWIRLYDRTGGRWAIAPDGAGGFDILSTPPSGKGTRGVTTLGDAFRTRWRLAIPEPPEGVVENTAGEPSGASYITLSGVPVVYMEAGDPSGAPLRTIHGDPVYWSVAGEGFDTPAHVGLASFPRVITSDEPPVLYTDAPTCYMLHDRHGVRWFWRIDPLEGRLVVSDILWPHVLSKTSWGEVAWFRMETLLGAVRYVLPNIDGMPMVRDIPLSDTSAWGIEEAILLHDKNGGRWQWRLSFDSVLQIASMAPSEMPAIVDGIHLRDLVDATGHVQDAGSIATVRVF